MALCAPLPAWTQLRPFALCTSSHPGLNNASLDSPSPGLCAQLASVSCCADPSGPRPKSPLGHWDRKADLRGAGAWHFLVSQDKQEVTSSGLACLSYSPCPVPISLCPADSSRTTPMGPFLQVPPLEADRPAPTEPIGHPDESLRSSDTAHTAYTFRLPALRAGGSPYRNPWLPTPWAFPHSNTTLSPSSLCK